MTDLRKLNVSLTKHGAHKIAALLKKYDKDEVLNHLSNSVPGINIEAAQARKTLSVTGRDKVPELWREAQLRGSETIDALVLLAITFSHHRLIDAMKGGAGKRPFSGTVKRGKHIDGKAYTNFACVVEELGYSTEHSKTHVNYDLHRLFQIKGFNSLVAQLLALKLESAGWEAQNELIDEVVGLGLHQVFATSKSQFRNWFTTGLIKSEFEETSEDSSFFFDADDRPSYLPFVFRPGHNQKKTGSVKIVPSNDESIATLLHNEIQNALFADLVKQYGAKYVGTENATGQGTSIDIVVKTDKFCWFYEIKTAASVRACIRQALPQLLEYAYWHGNDDRADRLIIVSPHPITSEAAAYLKFLRKKFNMKIYYQQYQLVTGAAE